MKEFFNFIQTWSWSSIWAGLASSIAFFSASWSYHSLRESKKLRKQNIVPRVVVLKPNHRYKLSWIPLKDLTPIIQPQFLPGEENPYQTRLPVFNLKNIGNAPAINLRITWWFEGESLQEKIKHNAILKGYNLKINDKSISLSKTIGGVNNSTTQFYEDRETHDIPYCVASPNTETTEYLNMPFGVSTNNDFRLLSCPRPQNLGFSFLDGPVFFISIEYEDLDGDKYLNKFEIEPSVHYLPDSTSSSEIPIERKHFSPDNFRGDITFKVRPIKNNK